MKRILKNKRGFTMAETIIALAIISMVSVSALALSVSAQNSSRLALQKQQAQAYAADIISCYRADGDFKTNVLFALGEEAIWTDKTEAKPIQIVLGGMTATLEQTGQTLTVTIEKDGKNLTSLEFTKRGTQP